MGKTEEIETKWDKLIEFMGNSDNDLFVRAGILIVGVILGLILVMTSALFSGAISIMFIVFGCVVGLMGVIGLFIWEN